MNDTNGRLTVLQGKFAAYLSWSQPFIHNLVSGVGQHVNNVVICNRTENLDRFPTPNVVRLKTRYLVNPALSILAAAYLQEAWRPTVMHAHFGWSGIRMLLLKQFLRIPLVTSFGGRDVGMQMHLPHFDRLYQVLLDASDLIICVSDDLRRQVLEAGVEPERVRVIRRGTDLSTFSFVDRSERRPDGPVQILMVGRLVEKKGHTDAFQALSELARAGHDFRLIIVGEGEEYRRLKKLREKLALYDHIEFAGVINHEGVRSHMRDADIFLHCSITGSEGDCEGLPNVIVEAAATGLPVVATRHGGIVEPVRHEQNGLLVEEHDPEGLREALKSVMTDRARRLEYGRAGRQLMEAEFDFDKQVTQHVAIYEELAQAYAADADRCHRMWIPEDFTEIVEQTLLYKENAKEFSLAELAESVLGKGKLDHRFMVPKPTLFERAYDLKRYLPQFIKFPLKLVLGRLIFTIMRLKNRKKIAALMRDRRQLDRSILTYFRQGGALEAVDSSWDAGDLKRFIPTLETGSQDQPATGDLHPAAERNATKGVPAGAATSDSNRD